MKYSLAVIMFFAGVSGLFGQDLKLVGSDEISLGVRKGESEEFTITLKNTTNKDIEITAFRNSDPEIFLYEQDDLTVKAGEKMKWTFKCTARYSGKQRFQVYIDYNSNGQSKKVYFVVKINPPY